MVRSRVKQILTILLVSSLLPIFMAQNDCQLNEAFNKLFKQIKTKIPPKSGAQQTYVTQLSFMDTKTQSIMAVTEHAKLIDEAVQKGMIEAARLNPHLAINEPGHEIKNTDGNVNTLVNITFDPNLTKSEKIAQISNKMMVPNNVDVIVTGQYIDDGQNPLISVRPLVIVKDDRKIVTKNLQFSKQELFCEDSVSKKVTLCGGAHDQIAQAIQDLLNQL